MKKMWMKGMAFVCAAIMTLSFAQAGFAQEDIPEGEITETESEQEESEQEESEQEESEQEESKQEESEQGESEQEESEYESLEQESWTVVFDAGEGVFEDGDKTKTYSAMDGESLDNVHPYDAPIAEGKQFAGWSFEENSKEAVEDLYAWYQVYQDVTFYAVWENAYTITLDAGEGFFYETDNKTEIARIEKGETIGTLQAPQIEESAEKAFDCYCFDKEGRKPVPADYVPDEDMTVYARWKGTYKVTFDAGDGDIYCGDGEPAKKKTILVGRGDALDSVYSSFYRFEHPYIDEKYKKAFAGWSTDLSGSSIIKPGKVTAIVPEGDMTLYAIWKEAVEITYIAGEGYFNGDDSCKTEQYIVGKGDPVGYYYPYCEISEDIPKAFAGWALDAKGLNIVDIESYEPTEDTTLYAVWADACVVTFVTDEGTFPDETQTCVFKSLKGEPLNFDPDLYLEGKEARWATDPDGQNMIPDLREFCPEKDITLYAVWKDSADVYFDAGEAEFTDSEDTKRTLCGWAAEGDTLSSLHFNAPMTAPAHKEFAGWATDPEGKNLIKDEKSQIISDGDVYYAIWKEVKTVPVLQVDHNQEAKLTGVNVDGKTIDENDYIIRQDGNNVVIELTETFKKTLPAGAKITAVFDSGSYDGEVAAGEIMNYAILSVENQDQEVEVKEDSSKVIGPVEEVVVEASGPYDSLAEVSVNGQVLQRDVQYVASPGSTIITFTKAYLKTLKAGVNNEVIISYKDGGTAKTTFAMEAVSEEKIEETETETVKETETESETIKETESETIKETEKETVKETEAEKARESKVKAEKENTSANTKAVKTEDPTPLLFLSMMMAVSVFAILMVLGKKRNHR